MRQAVTLTLNGERTEAHVEPRLHLADFLREQCRLTGTHLGCEHGVCGACTVLIDGTPARACIAFAVACDGQDVRTIEGFEDDALMSELRAAFTREHALQCGFCTPGMLIAARDVVLRCPDADEQRIRIEMSGNLCRCTGYLGIVNAVKRVIEARRQAPDAGTGPRVAAAVASAAAANAPDLRGAAAPWNAFTPTAAVREAAPAAAAAPQEATPRAGWHRIEDAFVADHAPARVWSALADVPGVARCLPGAEIEEARPDSVKGRINVRFGPMRAAFGGAAALERDDRQMEGRIRGGGNDSLTGSRAKADIVYRVAPHDDGVRARVAIVMDYNLQGPLAQFSRGGLVKDFTARLIAEFGRNLDAQLGAGGAAMPGSQASAQPASPTAQPAALDAGNLFWQWLWSRIKRLFGG